jgi:predicted RNA-binding protein YlqC (UPF0109 family)
MADPTASTAPLPGYDFLRFVLEQIVEDKESLKIEQRLDDLGVLLTVHVAEKDMAKLIGKQGQTVKSLRTLLRVVGGISNQRINLRVIEPNTPS